MGHAVHELRRRWTAVGILTGIAGVFTLGGLASAQPAPAKPPSAKPPAAVKPAAAPGAKPPASPGATEILGTVLAIQGEELVLDLGAGSGATDGATVEIWRPIKLKHPVTGKAIDDRFQIGSLDLLQVRTSMSLAKATAQLTRTAQVGDVVILQRAVRGLP